MENSTEKTDLNVSNQAFSPRETTDLRQFDKKLFEKTKEPLTLKSTKVQNRIFEEAVVKISNTRPEIPRKAIRKLKLMSQRGSSITDSTLYYLGESLRNLITLEDLTFDFDDCQKLTNKGMSNICKSLKKLRFLKRFRMDFRSCNKMTAIVFDILGRSLKNIASIETINLDFLRLNMENSGKKEPKSEGPEKIIKYLKNCRSLQRIYLEICQSIMTKKRFEHLRERLGYVEDEFPGFSCDGATSHLGLMNSVEKRVINVYVKVYYFDFKRCK